MITTLIKYIFISITIQHLWSVRLLAQSYSGTIHSDNTTIGYEVKLVKTENETRVFFTSIDMNAFEIPCQNATSEKDVLDFCVISDYYTYAYHYIRQNEGFKGKLEIYSNESERLLNSFETSLTRTNPNKQDEVMKINFTFGSNELQLYGTLWKPQRPIHKGLFFVTSSQGNDRSGTNAEAYYFTNLGYTVFNYDKRGTGNSEGDWKKATIEELCSDDINAIEFFSKISALPLSEIGIKGSSQGGIKIPYILSKLPDLGFGISISCPDGTLLESDLNHWKNLNIGHIGKNDIDQASRIQEAGYHYLAGNISYELLSRLKSDNSNEDWLKYVWLPERDVQKDYKLNFSGLPYFEKITQPVLVVQGLSDEVIPSNSYKTIEKAIGKSKSTNYQFITLEKTSHSMTCFDEEFPYFQLLSPEYLPVVTDWLKKIREH